MFERNEKMGIGAEYYLNNEDKTQKFIALTQTINLSSFFSVFIIKTVIRVNLGNEMIAKKKYMHITHSTDTMLHPVCILNKTITIKCLIFQEFVNSEISFGNNNITCGKRVPRSVFFLEPFLILEYFHCEWSICKNKSCVCNAHFLTKFIFI